jgi:gamma-glutamyltranspeptidase/glutathione hydrolase
MAAQIGLPRMRLQKLIATIFMLVPGLPLLSGSPVHPVREPHAIVVSVHELASRAGVDIMQAGGNAVDSAVATGFVLAVVYPEAGNLGGGGFMLIRFADGKSHFIDFREQAPAAATANMYLDAKGDVVPNASLVGYRAIGVPGSVAGLVYAEKKYGKLDLRRVMAPAIRLAQQGFILTADDARAFRDSGLAGFPESRRIFQRDGNYYREDEIFRQPELARTLQRIAENPGSFYRGDMARELSAAIRQEGGLITGEDLAKYEVKERDPVRGTYRGFEIIGAPPPSSAGICLLEILNILEGYDMASAGNGSARSMHLTIEAFRRAYFDRAEFLGDPDFSKIPVPQLIDKKYAAAWRQSIDPLHASKSSDLLRPANFGQVAQYAALHPQPKFTVEPEHTTHYSVVDEEGNAVAVTTTLNDSFGSRVTAGKLGFLLNDEMDDFAAKPGAPNLYGLIQSPANAIGPGKRPLSSMAPTMIVKDGRLAMVLGSPGGSRIITTVANILMSVVDYGMDIQQAVNSPRFHQQWLPEGTLLEPGFSPDTKLLLGKMGHTFKTGSYWSDGECIAIDSRSGERLGASDFRNNGKAVGY